MRLHIQTNHRQKYPRRRAARSSARFGRLFPHTLLIQARHLFYGLSLLGKYAGTGWKKPLLIFGLCDETFSITCSADVPPEVDRGWFYLWVTVLDWCYWVAGAALGGLLGGLFPFDTKGLDFVMTAMFVVIFVDNLLKEKQHWSSLIGIAGGTIVARLCICCWCR